MTGLSMRDDYSEFYRRITSGIRKDPKGQRRLQKTDRLLRGLMECIYPLLLAEVFLTSLQRMGRTQRWIALGVALECVLPYVLIPGLGFALLSLVRNRANWKRPYEEWDMDPLIHRDGTGCSMPSRHAFSAAVIAMCVLRESIPLGVLCLLLAAMVALCRVLGGVHYPADAAAGYLTGIAVGSVLGMGLTAMSLRLLLVISILLAASMTDLKEYRIPNRLVGALIAVYAVTFPLIEMDMEQAGSSAGAWSALAESLCGAMLLGGGLLLLSGIFCRITGKTGMGGGDIKLLFAVGLYLGPQKGILCLLISGILGLSYGLIGQKSRIPFGPAIAIGTMICLFRGLLP